MTAAQGELPEPERSPRPTVLMEATVLLSLALAVLSLFLFAWIANEMREGDTARFDLAVRSWVHQFASPGMTRVMTAISLLGYNLLIAELVFAIAVFLFLRWRHAAGLAGGVRSRRAGFGPGAEIRVPSLAPATLFWRCASFLQLP
jgi:hypothetical protein